MSSRSKDESLVCAVHKVDVVSLGEPIGRCRCGRSNNRLETIFAKQFECGVKEGKVVDTLRWLQDFPIKFADTNIADVRIPHGSDI